MEREFTNKAQQLAYYNRSDKLHQYCTLAGFISCSKYPGSTIYFCMVHHPQQFVYIGSVFVYTWNWCVRKLNQVLKILDQPDQYWHIIQNRSPALLTLLNIPFSILIFYTAKQVKQTLLYILLVKNRSVCDKNEIDHRNLVQTSTHLTLILEQLHLSTRL